MKSKSREVTAVNPLREDDSPVRGRGDNGSSLILALVFLVIVSLTAVALVQWAGNDLTATQQFTQAHALEAAANGSNAVAIQYVQYNFMQSSYFASPPSPCWLVSGMSTFSPSPNGPTVESWCSTMQFPFTRSTRIVTISTCSATISSGAECAANPLLQSIVTIDDVAPSTGIFSCSPTATGTIKSGTTCGQHLTINSWSFGALPPTVTSVVQSISNLPCTTVQLDVSGTGLQFASSVYFLVYSSYGVEVVPAPSLSYNPTISMLQVCTPTTSTLPPGTKTYVVVQTPTGTNAFGPNSPGSPVWTS